MPVSPSNEVNNGGRRSEQRAALQKAVLPGNGRDQERAAKTVRRELRLGEN